MSRPVLLDLFCCAGGASVGYARAGFDVRGVDHVRQPDYPFPFTLGNALRADLSGVHAVHASPPCKAHTPLRHTAAPGLFDPPHPDLIGPTRDLLEAAGLPYVIENVVGARAHLRNPVCYCGSSFGLPVRRHRLFESNVEIEAPPCDHPSQPVVLGVYGSGGSDAGRARRGGGGGIKVSGQAAADALGIDWTTDQTRLSQALPPAYTQHIGRQLLAAIG
jgi:DNA (cytosine-5)-methyltransferase 1